MILSLSESRLKDTTEVAMGSDTQIRNVPSDAF
jgi:hypothetical protein